MQKNQNRTLFPAILGLAIGSFLMISAAPAQQNERKYDNISTPEQRNACRADVFRHCAGEIPNVAQITACLQRKKASLSEACRAALP